MINYRPRTRAARGFTDVELLALLAEGLNQSQAARTLGVSRQAVSHRTKVFRDIDWQMLEVLKARKPSAA